MQRNEVIIVQAKVERSMEEKTKRVKGVDFSLNCIFLFPAQVDPNFYIEEHRKK